jgi:hypothetical protein
MRTATRCGAAKLNPVFKPPDFRTIIRYSECFFQALFKIQLCPYIKELNYTEMVKYLWNQKGFKGDKAGGGMIMGTPILIGA